MPPKKKDFNKNLTPEERYQRSIKIKRKFRAVTHLIIANLAWMEEVEDEKLTDNVRRNIAMLTRKKGKKGLISQANKAILNKPQFTRTEEEIESLRVGLTKLKCFKNYPMEVKEELPNIIQFVTFGENRLIIKQGNEPLFLYVLTNGEVVVSETNYDNVLKEVVSKDVSVMGPGDIFGEVALLMDSVRLASVTTSQVSEFLYISREDFDRVIKVHMLKFWNQMKTYILSFDYFQTWSQRSLIEACVFAKRKTFQPDQIIIGGGMGQTENVYFLMSGSCFLMEILNIRSIVKNGRKTYELYETEEGMDLVPKALVKDVKKLFKKKSSASMVKLSTSVHFRNAATSTESKNSHFLRICTFTKMACFNVGESLKNRFIVAVTDCVCMLMPRHFLMNKAMTTFKQVEHFLSTHIPSTQKLFNSYVEEKKWSAYKIRMVKELLQGKNLQNNNTIHNVPFTIRLAEDLGEI